jgi:hypothetical protein
VFPKEQNWIDDMTKKATARRIQYGRLLYEVIAAGLERAHGASGLRCGFVFAAQFFGDHFLGAEPVVEEAADCSSCDWRDPEEP